MKYRTDMDCQYLVMRDLMKDSSAPCDAFPFPWSNFNAANELNHMLVINAPSGYPHIDACGNEISWGCQMLLPRTPPPPRTIFHRNAITGGGGGDVAACYSRKCWHFEVIFLYSEIYGGCCIDSLSWPSVWGGGGGVYCMTWDPILDIPVPWNANNSNGFILLLFFLFFSFCWTCGICLSIIINTFFQLLEFNLFGDHFR